MSQTKKYFFFVATLGLLPIISLAQTAPLMPYPPSVAAAPSCPDFKINMRMGPSSDPMMQLQIINLQLALSREGLVINQQELGTFGNSTQAAVKAFQEKYSDDILAPFGITQGTGYVGAVTRLKLQALYGCRVSVSTPPPALPSNVSLAVTNLTLDNNGVSATFCNLGKDDLPTAPFRIRLNGINRDFEAVGAQKAGACTSDTWLYSTWGLSYDPGSTITAVGLIDPNGVYKTSKIQYPLGTTNTISVPALPGAHLSVRSILLKTTGLQATFCNLGTVDVTSFPVHVTVNSSSKDFDIPQLYTHGKCQPMTWTYDNWGLTYATGTVYNATVVVNPKYLFQETNEFDNVASVVGTP